MGVSAYEIVRSPERLAHVANEIVAAEVLGLDIETTGYNPNVEGSSSSPFKDDIRILSVNTGKGIYVIDLYETKGLGPVVPALAESKAVKVIQNAKYEQKWLLYKHDLELWPIFDPYRSSVLVHNGNDLGHNLYDLYERELKLAPPTQELGQSDWSGSLTKEQYDYAASDVSYLFDLRDSLKPKLASKGLNKVALIEFGAILPEAAVELNGFRLDTEMWLQLAEQNAREAEELRKQLIWELPNPSPQLTLAGIEPGINIRSTKQILASLRQLGIEASCEECRGKGTFRDGTVCEVCGGEGIVDLQNTREMTLAMHAAEFPVIKKLLQFRDRSKSVDSFGPDYLRHINPFTGRIHPDYFPFTGAGRYAASKPNLQQIPRDPRFRRCFHPDFGRKLVLCDYSNIEMRIVAEISGDRVLCEIFQNGEDAHRATASILVVVPKDQVSKDQRQQAKPVNFGFIYGMQAPKLVLYAQANYGVSLTLRQATEFRERFFETYSGIAAWHRKIFDDNSKRKGVVRTLANRLRYLGPDAHNEWANTPVQGTGADGLKAALRLVYYRLKKNHGAPVRTVSNTNPAVMMVHHVHDEIILETPDQPELNTQVNEDLSTGMHEGMVQFVRRVPVVTESHTADSWAEK